MDDPITTDSAMPAATAPTPRARPRRRRWTIALAIGLLLVAAFFVLRWLDRRSRPPIDPDLHGPEITRGETPREEEGTASSLITKVLREQPAADGEHVLDEPLRIARAGLEHIRSTVADYTATIVKQERLDGKLGDEEYMFCKVRHARPGDLPVPRSLYVRYLKPASLAGREAIWVDGRNDNKLIGHTAGLLNLTRFKLDPNGPIAMAGNRHPITELGMETLLVRMIERGDRHRQFGECEVEMDRTLRMDGQPCTSITIRHPLPREHFDFHIARIYVNDVLNLPVGYEGYSWPEDPGSEPVLVERYMYSDIRLNVGLRDIDFDPDNPEYQYP